MERLALTDSRTSSRGRMSSSILTDPSTPSRRGRSGKQTLFAEADDEDVEMQSVEGILEAPEAAPVTPGLSDDDEEEPCRHLRSVFADREFYTSRNARVVDEWKISEEHMKGRIK